jgi:ribosomal protein L24E
MAVLMAGLLAHSKAAPRAVPWVDSRAHPMVVQKAAQKAHLSVHQKAHPRAVPWVDP